MNAATAVKIRLHLKHYIHFVYVSVDVEVFSRFTVKRFFKGITEVKSYMSVLI